MYLWNRMKQLLGFEEVKGKESSRLCHCQMYHPEKNLFQNVGGLDQISEKVKLSGDSKVGGKYGPHGCSAEQYKEFHLNAVHDYTLRIIEAEEEENYDTAIDWVYKRGKEYFYYREHAESLSDLIRVVNFKREQSSEKKVFKWIDRPCKDPEIVFDESIRYSLIHMAIARCYYGLKEYKQAIDACKNAFHLAFPYTNDVDRDIAFEICLFQGDCHLKLEEFDLARESYEVAEIINSNCCIPLKRIAMSLANSVCEMENPEEFGREKFELAYEYIMKCLSKNPKNGFVKDMKLDFEIYMEEKKWGMYDV